MTNCLRLITVLFLLPSSPLAWMSAQEQPASATSAPLAELDISRGADIILVPVTLDRKEYLFLLDTGASVSAFDVSLRSLFGQPIGRKTVRGFVGSAELALYKAPPAMRVAGMKLRDDVNVALDHLEMTRRVSGYDIYGILGMDFLRHNVIEVDRDRGKLRFLRGSPSVGKNALPLDYAGSVAYVDAVIDNCYRQRLLLDTGFYSSASGALSRKSFEKLATLANRKADPTNGVFTTATGDTVIRRSLRKATLRIGETTALDVDFDEAGMDVLGLTFFARFKTVLDFPNSCLYLTPGRAFARPDETDQSGMHIWRLGSRVMVHSVDAGSAAAHASIAAGDEIVSIEDHDASKNSLHSTRLMLQRRDRPLVMHLRRGSKSFRAYIFATETAPQKGM